MLCEKFRADQDSRDTALPGRFSLYRLQLFVRVQTVWRRFSCSATAAYRAGSTWACNQATRGRLCDSALWHNHQPCRSTHHKYQSCTQSKHKHKSWPGIFLGRGILLGGGGHSWSLSGRCKCKPPEQGSGQKKRNLAHFFVKSCIFGHIGGSYWPRLPLPGYAYDTNK